MIDINDIPAMLIAFQQRHQARDERMDIIDLAVKGEFDLTDDFGDTVDNKSPNMIQVALEDTAEAASLVPSLRVRPSSMAKKDDASAMERIGTAYLDLSQIELLTIRSMLDLAAYGQLSWYVEKNEESGAPVINWRNPRMCYQEQGWHTMDSVRNALFVRELKLSQLPPEFQTKVMEHKVPGTNPKTPAYWNDLTITVVEVVTEEEIIVCALYRDGGGGPAMGGQRRSYIPIELERKPTLGGICPAVVATRMSLDGEPRGQFDQVVRVMKGHIQLMSTLLDYADQAVYCLAPQTKVLTENLEYVEVGKLSVGDSLIGFDEFPEDGTYRRWRRAEVLKTGRMVLPSYRVKLEDGTEFVASTDHKWLVGNSGNTSEWIPTYKLDGRHHSRHGIKVVKPLDLWERDESREAGYLAGVIDGEGWLSGQNEGSFRMGVAQRDNACLRDTENALISLGFDYTKSVMAATADNAGGPVYNLQILGGMREIIRLLMTVRPERMIDKFHTLGGADYMGRFKRHELVRVTYCEYEGDVEVVTLQTSTGTLIAEGYAHHNSDVWVKDLIGQMPVGGGSYIQLGPQGAIGRVQPAVSSLQVFEELDRLMDGIHLGGRWPKARPGEVSQSIASAKFLEASAGMMNTAIRTLHLIMKRALEQALRVCFVQDKASGGERTASGVLKNQQFMIEYDTADIDLGAKITVEYGLGLGREPAQSMVLGIQASQAGLVSTEFVQENFEGIQDVDLERRRIDVQKMKDMAFARLMEGMQSGEIPAAAMIKIAKARADGQDLFDLFEEFIVKPQEEIEQQQLTSGMDGSTMMPGGPPQLGGGMAAPPAPSPEELLGGGPPNLQSVGRTSVPTGGPGGGFAGVESKMKAS